MTKLRELPLGEFEEEMTWPEGYQSTIALRKLSVSLNYSETFVEKLLRSSMNSLRHLEISSLPTIPLNEPLPNLETLHLTLYLDDFTPPRRAEAIISKCPTITSLHRIYGYQVPRGDDVALRDHHILNSLPASLRDLAFSGRSNCPLDPFGVIQRRGVGRRWTSRSSWRQ